MALDFAKELQAAAWHTEAVGADAASGLRDILRTLTRIKDDLGGAGAASHFQGVAAEAAAAAGRRC
jgi:hypothetical protein